MGDPFEGLFESGEVLERVAVNLTTQARRGDLEPVRCRDAEIARVVDILLRQSKNNPALVGKAGVGKTAIVEGLAQRIAAGDVPPALKDTRVLALDHVALLAGTSFRGQYEERIRRLVRALAGDPDLILFVDELHNLIGQGTAVAVTDDALKAAIVLTDRFVTDRARPDKAIDVLDEACAHAQATARVSPELDRLVRERRKVDAKLRQGLTETPTTSEPAPDLAAVFDQVVADFREMLGGGSRGKAGEGGAPPPTSSDLPPRPPTLEERRSELDALLRAELESQGIVVTGHDVARVVGVAAGQRIA